MSSLTDAVMYRIVSSIVYGFDDVNNSSKYPDATDSISSSVWTQSPIEFLSRVILLRALLCLVFAWKYLVFRSPPWSQRTLLFCFQYNSSSLYAAHSLNFNSSSSPLESRSSFCTLSSCFFNSSMSNALLVGFRLFHLEIDCLVLFNLSYSSSAGSDRRLSHSSRTASIKPSLLSQFLLNLKFLLFLHSWAWNLANIGMWSDPIAADTPHKCGTKCYANLHC